MCGYIVSWLTLFSCILLLVTCAVDLRKPEKKDMIENEIIRLQDRLIEELCRIHTLTTQGQDVTEKLSKFWSDKFELEKLKINGRAQKKYIPKDKGC